MLSTETKEAQLADQKLVDEPWGERARSLDPWQVKQGLVAAIENAGLAPRDEQRLV